MEKTVRFGLVYGVGGGGGASSSRFPKRQRSSQQDLDESEYSEEVEEEEFPTVQRQARSQETRAADKGGGSKGNKTADPGKRSNNGPVSVTLNDPEVLDCPVCYEPLTIPDYQLFARQEQIQAALKDCKKKLGMIRVVLDDAVEQQTTKQSAEGLLLQQS